MLTENALRERKWGRFPALRKALEDKSIPHSYYGLTSISGNEFDAIVRLLEIAILLREHKQNVIEISQNSQDDQIYKDLQNLEEEFNHASKLFENARTEIQALFNFLKEVSYRQSQNF